MPHPAPRSRARTPLLLTILLLLPSGAARAADDPAPPAAFPGEGKATAKRLDEARKLLAAKKWDEAVEELQGILDAGGDDLVPVDSRESVQARRLCHALIAVLPADALAVYRKRVDPQAGPWLERGAARNDVTLLRKVVDQAFCSTPGERALDLLGDLAFERGRFDEALSWWHLLEPAGDRKEPGGLPLAYPGAKIDPALLAAKRLLARLYRGDVTDWNAELKAYRARHGKAEGTLGGRKGLYADLLAELARRRDKGEAPLVEWTTFGGDATRGLVLPAPPRFLDRLGELCRGGPTWRFDMQERKAVRAAPRAARRVVPASTWSRQQIFEPLIVWPYLLVADARYVTAFNLRDGKAETWYDAARFNGGIKPDLRLPTTLLDLRYTMTVAEDCVFARVGAQAVRDARPDANKRDPDREANNESLLVCLSLKPGKGGDRLRWEARAIDKGRAVFEGAPVVRGGLVYIAATRVDGDRAITAIHCYPVEANTAPPLRWSVDVCETREPRTDKKERHRHHLLTLAGPALVYCSHSGAVVAVDAQTGHRLWAVRYPTREDRSDEAAFRALAPCVAAAGRLYVTPADSDRLLCLDAATGALLWEREGLQVVHLLGVARGKVVFTSGRRPVGETESYGLRAVGAADGGNDGGWFAVATGGLTPMGRPLMIGDVVLWPTNQTTAEHPGFWVKATRLEDGRQPVDPSLLHRVPAGNLLYSAGCLAVADREGVSVFVPPELRLDELRKEAAAEDKPGTASLRRARGEAGAGHFAEALKEIERVERGGKGKFSGDVRRARWQVFLEQARHAAQAGRMEEARGALDRAAGEEFPVAARLEALRAATWLETKELAWGRARWREVAVQPALRSARVIDEDGRPWSGEELARERLRRLPGAKEDEEAARGQLSTAPPEKRTEALARVADQYPDTAAARAALAELAKLHAKEGRPGAAATAWRRLLALGVEGDERAAALIGLARAYEREGCREAARSAWERLAREQGETKRTDLDPRRTVRAFVAEHLQAGELRRPENGVFQSPLVRTSHVMLGEEEIYLPVETGDLAAVEGLVFSGPEDDTATADLVCRLLASGKERWRCRLGFAPRWAGCHADCLLTGGDRGAACVRLGDGHLLWRWLGPFPDGRPLGGWPEEARDESEVWTDFQLVAGRLFLMQGRRRLLALDAETGRVLWSVWAPDARLRLPHGRFAPGYAAGEKTVLVQTATGPRWSLDAATGRRLAIIKEPAWARPPCRLPGGDLCVVTTNNLVQRLDPATGKPRWTHRIEGRTTLSGEAPQVVVSAGRLVLLEAANVGYRLRRLDPETGKLLWSNPSWLREYGIDVDGWSVDEDSLYYVLGHVLYARSLKDGKESWRQPLLGPVGTWRTRRVGGVLLVWPEGLESRFRFRWLMGSVQWRLSLPPEAKIAAGTPLLCVDPATGKVIQRLTFAAGLPRAFGRPPALDALTMSPRLHVERVRRERTPAVRVSGKGLVVGLAGNVWALAPAPK